MAPLFVFLASSFNVELVYVILKGITQFSYFNPVNDKTKQKFAKLEFQIDSQTGDVKLHLNQIKIKDFEKWEDMKTQKDLNEVVKDTTHDVVEENLIKERLTLR